MTENTAWLSLLFEEDLYLTEKADIVNKTSEFKEQVEVNENEGSYDVMEGSISDDLIYFGNNSSKIGVIVYYTDHEWIRTKDQIFLNNILLPLKSSVEQIALVNIAKSKHQHISDIVEKLPGNVFFVFGIPESYYKGFACEQIENIANSKVILCSANLTDLAMDINIKRIFWKNMKSVFGL